MVLNDLVDSCYYSLKYAGLKGLTRVAQIVYTQTCNLVCTDLLMNRGRIPKLGQSGLLYLLKLPAEKERKHKHFKAI